MVGGRDGVVVGGKGWCRWWEGRDGVVVGGKGTKRRKFFQKGRARQSPHVYG